MASSIRSLADAMRAVPGSYAVLVGTGVSRSASIPTGWEIALDLIRRLAARHPKGDQCGLDPVAWYREHFGKSVDCAELLDALAVKPADRRKIFRSYFEPKGAEMGKRPTSAHHAIAVLAKAQFVRVIVTTSSDRLLDMALEQAGVKPTIIKSPREIRRALPLIHIRCLLLKLHGDYLDTRVRIAGSEVDKYPAEISEMLVQILKNFGLIVCGWGAEWDGALREVVRTTVSPHFKTYWAVHGNLGRHASALVRIRGAEVIQIQDADSFFKRVSDRVLSAPAPVDAKKVSVESSTDRLNRYLSDVSYKIELADLISEAVAKLVDLTSGKNFTEMTGPEPTDSLLTARVQAYEEACSSLLALSVLGGFQGEEWHFATWGYAIKRLGSFRSTDGWVRWMELRCYPVSLLFFALGLGAVTADRLQFLGLLFKTPVPLAAQGTGQTAVAVLPPDVMFKRSGALATGQLLRGLEKSRVPFSSRIFSALQPYATQIIGSARQYRWNFEKLEVLMALSFAYRLGTASAGRNYWTISGRYLAPDSNFDHIFQDILDAVSAERGRSRYVQSGIFGGSAAECQQGLHALKAYVSRMRWRW